MSKKCQYKDCDRGTYKEYCLAHRPRKAIKKKGKQSVIWETRRAEWIREHGTDHPCYICGIPLTRETITIDHYLPRSNAKNYANRHDDDNLKPACFTCNNQKGSKH